MISSEQSAFPTLGLSQPHRRLIVVLSIVLCAALALLKYENWRLDLYRASPGCVAGHQTNLDLSPCTWVNMRVDEVWYSVPKRGPVYYGLYLTDMSGERYSVRTFLERYQLGNAGDPVEAEIWRGSIVKVVLTNRHVESETPAHPDERLSITWGIVLLSGLVLGATLMLLLKDSIAARMGQGK